MLHTKAQGLWHSGSVEDDFLKGFTIYGHGSHLSHVTRPVPFVQSFPYLRSLHMNFKFICPCDFGEDV